MKVLMKILNLQLSTGLNPRVRKINNAKFDEYVSFKIIRTYVESYNFNHI